MSSSGYGRVGLKRTLGLFDVTAFGIGVIVGPGIFVVLGITIGYAGPAVIVSIIVAGIVASLTALDRFDNLGECR